TSLPRWLAETVSPRSLDQAGVNLQTCPHGFRGAMLMFLRSQPRRTRCPLARRLFVERLEGRTVPATVVWSGGPTGNGTDWLTPATWVGGALPAPNDDAVRTPTGATPTIGLAASTTVKSVSCNRQFQITGNQTALTIGAGLNNTSFLNLQLTTGT